MADIATLGLEVNSGQVDNATRSLNKMAGAARVAEQAANGFTGVATKAANSLGLWTDKAGRLRNATGQFASMQEKSAAAALASAGALDEQSAAALRASQAYKQFSGAANDNMKMASKFNTANIASQFQDIAVSAQMGMGAFQIGLQQGTQLAAVIGMMENPLRGLGAAFMSVISPVSLLTIGLVSLSAAGLQMVDWPKRASQALIFLADNLKAIAPYAATAAAALTLIYAPSVIAGMVNLIAWMGRVSVAAISMGASFALANPGTALILGITAAVAAANIFRDELQQILGVDIVGEAKKGVNKIIGFFVGAYNAISAMWKNLPTLFSAIGKEAWNSLVSQFEKESLWVEIAGKRFTLFEGLNLSTLKSDLSDIEKSALSTSKAFVDAATGDVDYLGGFTDAIGRGASAASDKLRELAKGLTDVDEKSKKGRNRHGKTDAEYYQDIIDGADRRMASLLVEQQALGMTEEAANALRYEQDLLSQAQQHGIELTPKQADYIKMLAGTMAGLESAIQKTQDAINFTKDTTKGFFSDMANGLANGRGWWGSLADAAVNAITKIAEALINSGIDSIFGGSGFGSLLGGLFGGKSADPWSGLRLAGGGYVSGPGSATSDSIPAWLSNGEFVMNAQATKAFGLWLQAMNDNKLRGFAYGGPVDGNIVSMPARSSLPSVREAAVTGSRSQDVNVKTDVKISFDKDGNPLAAVDSRIDRKIAANNKSWEKGNAIRTASGLKAANPRGYLTR